MSALPHVVWDMGGILFRYFTELLVEVGAERGWPVDRIPLGPSGFVRDADYGRLLAGELDEPDYLERIRDRLADHGIAFDPPVDLDWTGQQRPECWEAIRRIHEAGHRQAVLTNDASRWLGARWWETWEQARWFDALVDVATVGVRKPAPEPYLSVADALGVPPGECLFIDDMPANCRGAEAVGMESHLFSILTPEESVAALLRRLSIE